MAEKCNFSFFTVLSQAVYKSSAVCLQNSLFCPRSVIQLYSIASPPVLPRLPQWIRESSTHEQSFPISHTFKKCQKCFTRLVSALLVQSDVRTTLIKAECRGAEEVQRGGSACQGATVWFGGRDLHQLLLHFKCTADVCLLSLGNLITPLKSIYQFRQEALKSCLVTPESWWKPMCKNASCKVLPSLKQNSHPTLQEVL